MGETRPVTVTANTGGIARANRVLATRGETVTITASPHSGNELDRISATDAFGEASTSLDI